MLSNSGLTNFKPTTKKVKSCKLCPKPRLGNLSLCSGCWRTREREKRAKKKEVLLLRKAKSKERKANSFKTLKKTLDKVFSEYVRRRAVIKGSYGKIRCVCCGVLIEWKKAQNMHYVGRADMNTRWDLRNCKAGCMRCNVMLNGNYPAYTKYLLDTYGVDWLNQLILDGRKIKQWTVFELKSEIEKYTELLKTL